MSLETMTKLATVTVGVGGASSISFSNIPQTYTDLVLKLSLKSNNTSGGENVWIRFNGDSGANYATRRLYGSGTAAASDTGGTTTYINAAEINDSLAASANAFGNADLYIPNYTSSTFKSISADAAMEANQTTIYMGINAGLWSNTAPITSIAMTVQVGTLFVANSTATLYGVKAARTAVGNSIKATGGAISFDGTYVYHEFNSSDTFTPTSNIRCDYIIVAGGGGGGGADNAGCFAGGGGAGGYRSFSNTVFNYGTSYPVTIGAGGTGGTGSGTSTATNGTSGSNSTFNSLSATGGGYGAYSRTGYSSGTPGNGGSGGGAGYTSGSQAGGTGNAGGYSPVEGYAGGTAVGANGGSGAGGGGATGAGAPYGVGGTGATYVNLFGMGSSTVFSTGGRYGPIGVSSPAATPNSGNGGVGGWNHNGGAGGSGVVIIRYKA